MLPKRPPFAFIASFLAVGAALDAQIAIANPSLPPSESIVYLETTGSEKELTSQELRLVSKGAESWYEVKSESVRSKSTTRFDAKTLFPFYSETIAIEPDSEIRRVTELLRSSPKLKADEMAILDMNGFAIQLRGFPWGSAKGVKLVAMGGGTGQQSFSFTFTVVGKEKLLVGGKSYECYKAQLGLDGIWSAVFPKTTLWYSAAAPHFLVRYDGVSGGPGSPKRIVELQSYRASTKP